MPLPVNHRCHPAATQPRAQPSLVCWCACDRRNRSPQPNPQPMNPTCLMRPIDLRTLVRRAGSGMRSPRERYISFSPCSRVRSLSSTNLLKEAGEKGSGVCAGQRRALAGWLAGSGGGAAAEALSRRLCCKCMRARGDELHMHACTAVHVAGPRHPQAPTRACGGRPSSSYAGLPLPSPALQRIGSGMSIIRGRSEVHPRRASRLPPAPPPAAAAPVTQTPRVPDVGGFASSLGGSTMSSSRPRRLVEVVKAAPARCSRLGSESCSDLMSAMGPARAQPGSGKRAACVERGGEGAVAGQRIGGLARARANAGT